MPGATIDHLVSLVLLISVLLASFSLYSNMLANAIAFQRYHQVAMKTADLVDGMCLSPGIPSDWGTISGIPSTFGLQDPEIGSYALSPFPIMRIMDPSNTISFGGSTFLNFSMGPGAYFFLPVAEHVNYSSVTRLLGVNTSYGFRLTITPTLRISISEMEQDPLQISVVVKGPGAPVSGAMVNATLLCASKGEGGGQTPFIELLTNTAETDVTGSALMTFPTVDATEDNYSIVAQVNLSGLNGISFYSNMIETDSLLVPVITIYEEGEVMLVHLFDITEAENPPADALFYNMTYYVRTWNFGFRPIEIENSTGKVELGHSGEDFLTIPTSAPGILVITWSGVISGEGRVYRTVMMPWGMGAFGMQDPITFGGDPSGHEWVATELRQVTVNQISYQVKLAAWKLGM